MAGPPDLARVAVVGTSCSGKTTFAERLAALLGVPHFELDALYWGAAWTVRPEFHHDVALAAEQPRWVVDGNYTAVRDLVWGRATTIVWLDYSFPRVFGRALRRTVLRVVSKKRLYGGNRETVRNSFISADGIPLWVIRTHAKRRREFPGLLARPQYSHATVIRFRTPPAAAAFLDRLGGEQAWSTS
jgi:adenylate kinase family enzyme